MGSSSSSPWKRKVKELVVMMRNAWQRGGQALEERWRFIKGNVRMWVEKEKLLRKREILDGVVVL